MRNPRVLLVDDEEEFVDVLAMRLEVRRFHVQIAHSGEQALEIAKQAPFDVALLDLTMPGIDGVETLKRLKVLDPDLQVIVLTGHSTTDKGNAAMAHGARDLFAKPARFSSLLEELKAASADKIRLLESRGDE